MKILALVCDRMYSVENALIAATTKSPDCGFSLVPTGKCHDNIFK
jgi:hypothetical protein